MKKRFGLIAALLAVTALVGCAKEPTKEEYEAWAKDNGYVLNPDYAGWAEENGYVPGDKALPAARLEGKTSYKTEDSGIQIAPKDGTNAASLADYLDREDVFYVDLRDASSYTQGHIEGFEWIPHFDIIMNKGNQLFATVNDKIVPNYEESVAIIKSLFPQDKVLFLMCQSGGRVVSTMNVLEYCGYDMSKVYNVGGYGQVNKNTYKVVAAPIKVEATYDFSALTPVTAE